MADLSERHEVRIQGAEHTFVFLADSTDGRLTIRQEAEGKPSEDVCAITLANPEELRTFFKGLRRVLDSMGLGMDASGAGEAGPPGRPAAGPPTQQTLGPGIRQEAGGGGQIQREAIIEKARERNPKAFAAWTPEEEGDVRRRYQGGQSVPEIARIHRRSPRAIELRLQRLGLLPPDSK